jgi:hypothetical protein
MRATRFALPLAAIMALGAVASPGLAADLLAGPSIAGLSHADISGFREAYAKQGVDFSAYTQVAVAPLAFADSVDKRREDDIGKITPRNREYLAKRYAEIMARELGESRTPTDLATAPKTLVIEAKLLAARANRTPYDMRPPGMINAYIYGVGSAAIEFTIRDGASGAVLMRVADRREGENLKDNFNRTFFWGDVETFMRRWGSALDSAMPAKTTTKAS